MKDKDKDKDKIVDEMARDIKRIRESYYGKADYLFAMKLHEDNYRKIPEDAVVLTREEAEQVYETVKDYGKLLKDLQEVKSVFEKEMEEVRKEVAKQFEECKKQARKETARAVLKEVKELIKMLDVEWELSRELHSIAVKYGEEEGERR